MINTTGNIVEKKKLGRGFEWLEKEESEMDKGNRDEARGGGDFWWFWGAEGGRAAFVRPGSNHVASELQARRFLPSHGTSATLKIGGRRRSRATPPVGTLEEIVTSYIFISPLRIRLMSTLITTETNFSYHVDLKVNSRRSTKVVEFNKMARKRKISPAAARMKLFYPFYLRTEAIRTVFYYLRKIAPPPPPRSLDTRELYLAN